MTQTQHTPTPWMFKDSERGRKIIYHLSNSSYNPVAETLPDADPDSPHENNAAFIVKACNAYDEMLAFIEKVAAWDFDADNTYMGSLENKDIEQAQAEAFELIKKVRG